MIDAFEKVQPPPSGYKIVAVDNASTDDTARILEAAALKLPLTYIHEERRGKNRALNRALEYVAGDFVVFTDDDVLPRPDWLIELVRAGQEHQDYSGFGGPIEPFWETDPPAFALSGIPQAAAFAITPSSRQEGEITPGAIWGPNMMVRRSVFDDGIRFDESIGPAPGQYIMGSETDFNIRLAELGHKFWYTKRAIVLHYVRDYQLDFDWLMNRAFRFGRALGREHQLNGQTDQAASLLGMPRWVIGNYLSDAAKSKWCRMMGNEVAAARHGWNASKWRGYLYQLRNNDK